MLEAATTCDRCSLEIPYGVRCWMVTVSERTATEPKVVHIVCDACHGE